MRLSSLMAVKCFGVKSSAGIYSTDYFSLISAPAYTVLSFFRKEGHVLNMRQDACFLFRLSNDPIPNLLCLQFAALKFASPPTSSECHALFHLAE